MTIRAGYSLTVNTQFYHLFVGMWTRPHAWLCCALPPPPSPPSYGLHTIRQENFTSRPKC